MSVTKSCRVTESMSDRLGDAAEESKRLEGELVREAIRFYAAANPQGYRAFRDVDRAVEAAQGVVGEREASGVYDPVREET